MNNSFEGASARWIAACKTEDVPHDGGVCVKYNDMQIALFRFSHRNEWYASQNSCPHRQQMALSRGMLGSHKGEPKVACPFHKKTFSLVDGRCLNSEENLRIQTFDVKVEGNTVYILIDESALSNNTTCSHTAYE